MEHAGSYRHPRPAEHGRLVAAAAGEVGAQAGAVVGTVFDSINSAPLVDAAVFLWETPYRGVSDEEGRFRIDGVPPGEYSVLLLDGCHRRYRRPPYFYWTRFTNVRAQWPKRVASLACVR